MEKMLFIYNPHTGGGKLKNKLLQILDIFAAAGYADICVHPTTAVGDARKTAERLGGKFDIVVCCGGDGTLNEVVGGIIKHNPVPRLGYIPGGTTNDFASSLLLPKSDMLKAAERVVNPKKVFSVDAGIFNERNFNYVAAFGAFTDVAYKTPQRFKNVLGYFAYILEGAQHLGSIAPCHAKLALPDGTVHEGDYLFGLIANSTSVGGFTFPNAKTKIRLDDGQFEALLVKHPHSLAELRELSAAVLTKNISSPLLTAVQFTEATLTTDEDVEWTLDGEYGGSCSVANIKVLNKAVPICI